MINIEKIYKAIDYLKKAGNPYYQFYDDFHAYEERCINSDRDKIISKSLHDAWDEEIMKDLADLDINEQSDERYVASKLTDEVGCKKCNNKIVHTCQEDEDNKVQTKRGDPDINKQSDDSNIASMLGYEELLRDVNEGETFIASIKTFPGGYEGHVNVNLLIDIYNHRRKDIINLQKDCIKKTGEERKTYFTMCKNPSGFEQCACMIINVQILDKIISWIVCNCEDSTVPFLI